MARTIESTARIPGQLALEEIVTRFAIGQGIDVRQDQPFFGIDNHHVVIDGVERLLHVVLAHELALVTYRVYGLVGGQGHASGILAFDMRIVAGRAEGCRDNAL